MAAFVGLAEEGSAAANFLLDSESKMRAAAVGIQGTPGRCVVCDMDLDLVTQVRQTWQFYRDRRPEAYGDLVRP